jgi:hypothetical protein
MGGQDNGLTLHFEATRGLGCPDVGAIHRRRVGRLAQGPWGGCREQRPLASGPVHAHRRLFTWTPSPNLGTK